MKKISFILIALAVSSSIACISSTNSSVTPENVHPSLLDDDPWNDTLEYTQQDIINLRDTLIGNFSGQGNDTLIAEPIGYNTLRKNFRIYSTSGKIKPLYIEEIWSVHMIHEGDLDGDGTNEFGIRWELEMGNWTTYHLFTYKNNK